MGLHLTAVALQGDHLQAIPSFLEKWGRRMVIEPKAYSSREAVDLVHSRHAVAFCLRDGWTLILQREVPVCLDNKFLPFLKRIAKEWNTKILGWDCEGASDTYGFAWVDKETFRAVCTVEGQVCVDEGAPLSQEAGIAWSDAGQEEIQKVCEGVGVPFDILDGEEYSVALPEHRHWWKFWR